MATADPNTLGDRMKSLHAALRAGESAKLPGHFTEFATLLAPGTGRVVGNRTVVRFYEDSFADAVAGMDMAPQSVRELGADAALEWGELSVRLHDGRELSGHYLQVWQKEESGWVIRESMYNLINSPGS